MKHAVMCVQRSTLPAQVLSAEGQITPFKTDQLQYEGIEFINRTVVDAKRKDNATYYSIGTMFPQLLPYMLIRSNNQFLTYNRKGTEQRLHGLISIGVGGHIDIHDVHFKFEEASKYKDPELDIVNTIQLAAERELVEEIGLHTRQPIAFDHCIMSFNNEVGQVHLGLLAIIDLDHLGISREALEISDEILNPRWLSIEQLRDSIDECEDWSQIAINWLSQGE